MCKLLGCLGLFDYLIDPKLSYSEHLTHISQKIANRVNLIRKLKGLMLKNQVDINLIIYKSLIRSIIDYAFIPLISSTQRILNKVQSIQNNTLRTIKRFSLRSSTAEIDRNSILDSQARSKLEKIRQLKAQSLAPDKRIRSLHETEIDNY
jgi:hypothetical protein